MAYAFPLQDIFDSLESPVVPKGSDDAFAVQKIEFAGFSIAKSSAGRPAFLVSEASGTSFPHFSVSLANLRATYRCRVKLISKEEGEERIDNDVVSIVECLSDDVNLHELFIRSVGNAVGTVSKAMDLGQLVRHLAELFRFAESPPQGSVLGLWAELWVISIAEDPSRLVRAWHATTTGRADFADQSEQIDVKATESGKRHHSMSFDQANPPNSVSASIISVMTEQIGDGCTLGQLWSLVQEKVSADLELVEKIDRLCYRTLGRDYGESLEIGFDESRALDTCQVFSVEDIPRISSKPPGVLNVRFEVDLSSSEQMVSGFTSEGLTDLVVTGLAQRRR